MTIAKSPSPSGEALPSLTFTRTFDAPRALVWKVWTDPVHMAAWWGPHDFTNPVCEMDVRLGGTLKIDMRAPDGTVYPMTGVFKEITEPERLSFTCTPLDDKGEVIFEELTTVTFTEKGGKTLLNIEARILWKKPEADAYLQGMEEGWSQSLVRLGSQVARAKVSVPAEANRELINSRFFKAPRELVFEAWTKPEHVAHWYGPNGFTLTIHEMDVRPGGMWRYIMHGPDGTDYDNRVVYEEISHPERLVYLHGHDRDNDPEAFHVTVTFEEEDGGTRLTMRLVMATAEQREASVKFGAVEGGNQTLSRLAAYLPTMAK
ncbi:uncharacterized protein YndB with AHSA1/START domain [Roseimicrobium gellanilyticum]|uniref:Uncharacterized protein YndB with AHSA1/START domain n=1 Tax=Roseimicrobium gellanilyticum TaxID=748857 RepID=A0A366H3L1_9BACT|nr:SRPBCC family protein [Roseimicrobium gellanilyticum]RBP36139.1 uncharacterized protein YndB with AHSA1/START domain [Roseimicrobium gellanilyticum]